jgi:putative ABC transport system permease protein
MGAYTEAPVSISGMEAAERLTGAVISAGLFDVLGVRPALGRVFLEEEDRVGAAPAVIIADDLWKRRFAADPAILGRAIRVNGTSHTVVGVMPPRFRFPEFAEVWLPLAPVAQHTARDDRQYGVVARLRPNLTVQQADAEMRTLAAALEAEHPDTQREWTARAVEFRRDYAGEVTELYGVMLGAVACVLLIVCANLAGLMLVRGASRQKEIAIRLALGAGRPQLVRQLLAESIILGLVGGAAGLVLAGWLVDFAVASLRTAVPFWIDFAVDGRALTFCLIISIATGVVFGLVPALRASRPDVQSTLKQGGHAQTASLVRSRLRSALVVGELAVALVLLAGAGVLMKSFLRVSVPESGQDIHNVLTGSVEFLDARYADDAQVGSAAAQIIDRLSGIPGVSTAAMSRAHFIAGFGAADERVLVEGVPSVPDGASPRFATIITPSYFSALRLPLVAGRTLGPGDRQGAPLVAVINARMARQLWPAESPLGKRLRMGSADSLPWLTVVGVVGDVVRTGRTSNQLYVPFAQHPGRPATLLVRGEPTADVRQLAPVVRSEVSAIDPDLPVVALKTMEEEHHDRFWPYQMYALFMSGFAALAILLAAVGLYGLVAYGVAQRTREIGIRMALGADRMDVLRLVTGQGARLLLAGVFAGVIASAGALQILRSMLFGASPVDPGVFALVSLLLVIVALLASYIPARRAASVDPMIALRSE